MLCYALWVSCGRARDWALRSHFSERREWRADAANVRTRNPTERASRSPTAYLCGWRNPCAVWSQTSLLPQRPTSCVKSIQASAYHTLCVWPLKYVLTTLQTTHYLQIFYNDYNLKRQMFIHFSSHIYFNLYYKWNATNYLCLWKHSPF